MKKACAALVVSGRTAMIKEYLTKRGFKYHSLRKSWVKFDDAEKFEQLKKEGTQIALDNLGNVLIDTFVSERKDNTINF